MNKELLLLVGPQGSGKSTLAATKYKEYFRISQDEMKDYKKIFQKNLKDGVEKIIIDRINHKKNQRDYYITQAKKEGYTTRIIVLHVPIDVCKHRIENREDHPTLKKENSSKALNTFFKEYERVEDTEAHTVEREYFKPDKINAIWIDMDNTLSNACHREHFLSNGKRDWKGFFDAMKGDSVNEWCKHLIDGMKHNSKILICSARPDDYKKVTEEWLNSNGIHYDRLIMRPRGDYRKDSIVKEVMLDFEILPLYNLIFSVDDRHQVIEHIRNRGVTVLDCAGDRGNF